MMATPKIITTKGEKTSTYLYCLLLNSNLSNSPLSTPLINQGIDLNSIRIFITLIPPAVEDVIPPTNIRYQQEELGIGREAAHVDVAEPRGAGCTGYVKEGGTQTSLSHQEEEQGENQSNPDISHKFQIYGFSKVPVE